MGGKKPLPCPRDLNFVFRHSLETARKQEERQVTGKAGECPQARDLQIKPEIHPPEADRQDQQDWLDGVRENGARVQFEHVAVEIWRAEALRQPVARAAHGKTHIAVAMRLGAVHNELVGRF